jgi:hypothetical protein
MNKRKTIYKGFNKRRKNKMIKIYIIGTSIFIMCGYGFTQLKDSKILNNIENKLASTVIKMPFVDFDKYKNEEDKLEVFEYDDISKEDKTTNEENIEVTNEDVNVATIKGWNIYTIQVASVEDKNEINKVEKGEYTAQIPAFDRRSFYIPNIK